MAEDQQPHAILARAARYPYEAPLHSFVQTGARTEELPHRVEPDLSGRTAVLAYGAVPSTLQRSPGTHAPVHVAYPTQAQLRALAATEPNYELRELTGAELHSELGGEEPSWLLAFLSRHGCLSFEDAEIALAAVESHPRRFRPRGEIEVLEHVRHLLAPELSLERFVESSLDPGLAGARTAVLRGNAIPFAT